MDLLATCLAGALTPCNGHNQALPFKLDNDSLSLHELAKAGVSPKPAKVMTKLGSPLVRHVPYDLNRVMQTMVPTLCLLG